MKDAADAASELSLLAATLDDAVPRLPATSRRYRIAGASVAIRAGNRAALLLEAFAPLGAVDDRAPATLDIFIFDAATDKVELPDVAITRCPSNHEGEQRAVAAPGIRAFFQPEAGVLSLLDERRRRAYCWMRCAATLPYYEHAAPLRHILQWWMLSRNGALLHSAAVGAFGGGVLIAGPSGSGKSTTALACQAAGLGFTSDDYVLVCGDAPPTVHMAYSTAKVLRTSLSAHGAYRDHFRNLDRDDEKPMLFMHEAAPERVLRSFPLRALVLPVVAKRSSTRIVPATAAELLRALAPSSILLFPLAGAVAFRRMAALCRAVPCLRAELSEDPCDVAEAFTRLLRDRAIAAEQAVA
ncbi:MAG: hypothetical protein ABJC33_07855 [Betaproteobacteria bacterium]